MRIKNFNGIPIRIFGCFSKLLISNILLFMNQAKVNRVVYCNIRKWEVEETLKKGRVKTDIKDCLSQIKDDKQAQSHILEVATHYAAGDENVLTVIFSSR